VSSTVDNVPDDELWQRASRHDGPAFGVLFQRHAKAVYNHCFRRTGSWTVAQDLTSVVFLEAWRRRRDVRLHGESILPWLLAVANNCIRNSDRSVRRHHRLLAKLSRADIALRPEEARGRIEDEDAMTSILEKINGLRIEEREVVALIDWAELSYAEAAASLCLPEGTVRSRLSRAHEHLRDLINADPDPAQRARLGTLAQPRRVQDASS
jgi:RNA polymerase sigma-70 factor (ECF subfamily)